MYLLTKLENLPMPPSVNQCYVNVGKKRVSSASLRKFKNSIAKWHYINKTSVAAAKEELLTELKRKIALKFIFRFPEKKIYIKKTKRVKKLDVSNRIKAAEDAITDMLGFDDKLVFKVEAEKVTDIEKESFDIFIYSY